MSAGDAAQIRAWAKTRSRPLDVWTAVFNRYNGTLELVPPSGRTC